VEPDRIQIDDWDDEAEEEAVAAEEEELARVQLKIERLQQEQESILKRQATMQRAEAHRQNINKERVRFAEMQYNLDILHHQGREAPLHNQIPNQPPPPPPSPPHNQIPHKLYPPPPPQNHLLEQPFPQQMGTIDPKSPLVEHLQLALWPLHYRAVPPPKYHGNKDPRKFLMCYEAAIASAGGDEATLAKSLTISLEDAAVNWYSRLPPRCIQVFQVFQVELDTEEDFLSCVQKERKSLLDFYRRFLRLKAQAPKVSDEQVIAQAIKALRAGPLHSHFVQERPKTVLELYNQFAKFSKSKIQHFCKLEQ
jgi:hypothetical protein